MSGLPRALSQLLLAFALVSALLSDLLVIPAFLVMLGEEESAEGGAS